MKKLLYSATLLFSLSVLGEGPPPELTKVLKAKCISCHGEDRVKGNLDLLEFLKSQKKDMSVWQKVYNAVSTETMPPPKKKALSEEETAAVLLGIKDLAGKEVPVVSRLLTPAEIKYTLYDIFTADEMVFDPAVNLKTNYSFDSFHTMQRNKMSSYYLDNLFHAFNETVNSYTFVKEPPRKLNLKPVFWQGNHSGAMHEGKLYVRGKWKEKINEIFFNSEREKKIPTLPAGKYRLTFDAVVENKDFSKLPSELKSYLEETVKDGIPHIGFYARPFRQTDEFGKQKLLKLFKMDNTEKKTFSFEFTLNREMSIGLIFDNGPNEHRILKRDTITKKDTYNPITTYDRKEYPFLQIVFSNYKIEGPFGDLPSKVNVNVKDADEKIAAEVLDSKFKGVYQRSGVADTPSHLKVFAKLNSRLGQEKAYRYTLVNFFMSPEFLNISNRKEDGLKFSRFAAYSLLKSPPGSEFLQNFKEFNKSHDADSFASWLAEQPEFERFVRTFISQWLKMEKIQNAQPDPEKFPEYYQSRLYEKFLSESSQLLLHIIKNNRPITELYTADYSFLNEELVSFYKNEKIKIDYKNVYSRQSVEKGRGGLLSHGSFLTANSNGVEPLAISRAVWVLENVLDLHLPAPPDNIDVSEFEKAKSLKFADQLKAHSQNSSCSSCHRKMDPVAIVMNEAGTIGERGFAEKFNAVDLEGTSINSYTSFKEYIEKKEEKVARAFLKNLIMFTQGRSILIQDEIKVDRIVKALEGKAYKARDLFAQLIKQYY